MDPNTFKKNFHDIITSENLVLVDFHAEWCGPCKMMKPILEEVKAEVGDKVRIIKVDVDRNAKTASLYRISGVPTLLLFKKGKIVWRQSGVVPPGTLRQLIAANS